SPLPPSGGRRQGEGGVRRNRNPYPITSRQEQSCRQEDQYIPVPELRRDQDERQVQDREHHQWTLKPVSIPRIPGVHEPACTRQAAQKRQEHTPVQPQYHRPDSSRQLTRKSAKDRDRAVDVGKEPAIQEVSRWPGGPVVSAE